MCRTKPFPSCARTAIPWRIRIEILIRQEGRCADCGIRLDVEKIVFDHHPLLALREPGDDPNDPDRLAAICIRCDRIKTCKGLVEIARAKRLARDQAEHEIRLAAKVCGRPRLSHRSERKLERLLGDVAISGSIADTDLN